MAITFNFTLNDIDAENLFHWLHDAENKCDLKILDETFTIASLSDTLDEEENHKKKRYCQNKIDWYKAHKNYISCVITRMLGTQTRIDDSIDYEVCKES